MQKTPNLVSETALIKGVPGVTLPPGAVGALFPVPFLPPMASVRVTYAESPGCPGQILLPIRWEELRLLASEPPTLPAGVAEVDPSVFLQVVVDVDGTFRRPAYVAGPRALTAAAIAAIAKWRASPARINGQPIVSVVALRVAFK